MNNPANIDPKLHGHSGLGVNTGHGEERRSGERKRKRKGGVEKGERWRDSERNERIRNCLLS